MARQCGEDVIAHERDVSLRLAMALAQIDAISVLEYYYSLGILSKINPILGPNRFDMSTPSSIENYYDLLMENRLRLTLIAIVKPGAWQT